MENLTSVWKLALLWSVLSVALAILAGRVLHSSSASLADEAEDFLRGRVPGAGRLPGLPLLAVSALAVISVLVGIQVVRTLPDSIVVTRPDGTLAFGGFRDPEASPTPKAAPVSGGRVPAQTAPDRPSGGGQPTLVVTTGTATAQMPDELLGKLGEPTHRAAQVVGDPATASESPRGNSDRGGAPAPDRAAVGAPDRPSKSPAAAAPAPENVAAVDPAVDVLDRPSTSPATAAPAPENVAAVDAVVTHPGRSGDTDIDAATPAGIGGVDAGRDDEGDEIEDADVGGVAVDDGHDDTDRAKKHRHGQGRGHDKHAHQHGDD